ncbi:MAG: pyridoxamine 5'-phosphate oxidase family protein [Desulfuromonadaceae bacterium]|nr:pyridoxamine 5'-phosphate oxidase family protein [Desulfuromonadaceae bacterium]
MKQNVDSIQLQELLREPGHLCTLSTVTPDGTPNSAVFGSVRLLNNQIILGLGHNQTLRNLHHNPHAMLMVVLPGASVFQFRGMRLYLHCSAIETNGPLLDEIRAEAQVMAGRTAAKMLQVALKFEIISSRPLLDMGSS